MASPARVCVCFSLLLALCAGAKPPNFVLFLTDDQDLLLDGMLPMRQTIALIGNEGATFANAYVHAPLCCPSRSSLLTGRFLHNVRVVNNSAAGNCAGAAWRRDAEPAAFANTLRTRLGYRTFYAGKYLNQYADAGVVPPGYDWWCALLGNSKYYNFTLSVNGTRVRFADDVYLTDLLKRYAEDFLRSATPSRPFLMVLATPAAHAPFTPAPRHAAAFADASAARHPAFNLSAHDKHWLLQMPPTQLPADAGAARLDAIQRGRLQTLLAVDELVADVVAALAAAGVLDDTYVLFTSDNGFHVGQFGMPWDKRQPYEADVHVPLLVRGPRVARKRLVRAAVSLVDVAPTLLQLAGLPADAAMDGQSFADVATGAAVDQPRARALYVEYFGEADAASVSPACGFHADDARHLAECSPAAWCRCQDARNNTFRCVLLFDAAAAPFKYCQFADAAGFVEAYDLAADALEAHNLRARMPPAAHAYYARLLRHLAACAGADCHSPPLRR